MIGSAWHKVIDGNIRARSIIDYIIAIEPQLGGGRAKSIGGGIGLSQVGASLTGLSAWPQLLPTRHPPLVQVGDVRCVVGDGRKL